MTTIIKAKIINQNTPQAQFVNTKQWKITEDRKGTIWFTCKCCNKKGWNEQWVTDHSKSKKCSK